MSCLPSGPGTRPPLRGGVWTTGEARLSRFWRDMFPKASRRSQAEIFAYFDPHLVEVRSILWLSIIVPPRAQYPRRESRNRDFYFGTGILLGKSREEEFETTTLRGGMPSARQGSDAEVTTV
jgi:hypothetical protein